MAQRRPQQNVKFAAPLYGLTWRYENRYTHVSCPYERKSLLAPYPKTNRKSAIFTVKLCFAAFFAIFTARTLTKSS